MLFLTLLAFFLAALTTAVPTSPLVSRQDDPEIPSIQDQEFISIVLNAHWYWRRIHCAQDLQWSESLAVLARNDIKKCTHGVQHVRPTPLLPSPHPPSLFPYSPVFISSPAIDANQRSSFQDRAGSNLSGVSPPPRTRAEWLDFARTSIHGWHEEETMYDYVAHAGKGGYGNILHFTQLVWRDSSSIGCALADCEGVEGVEFPGRVYCCE